VLSDVAKTQVKLYLEQEQPESLAYIDCPECGQAQKLMLVPLDDGGTFAKCLRASCETFGSVGSTYRRDAPKKIVGARRTFLTYRREPGFVPLHRIGNTYRNFFHDGYRIPKAQVNTLVAGKLDDRWVFPVLDRLHRTVGYVARGYNHEHKALLRPYFKKGPLMAWYGHKHLRGNLPLVVVEDQVSAARLSEYLPAVALLGTTASDQDIEQLEAAQSEDGNIIVMLDQDATDAAFRLARRIRRGLCWPLVRTDVKDMDPREFSKLIELLSGTPDGT
jgi:hypothetical protein